MKEFKKHQIFILSLLIIGYILVRLWNLTDSCLFFDEIFSLHAAQHSWNSMLWFIAQDLIHPPLSYILLKFWMTIGGDSLVWVRLFPVFFSILALVPFCLLSKELKLNFNTFALALTFFAFNGILIKYAQEVRMYSLLLCFGLFSIWLFVRFLSHNKGLIWLTVINILLIYTHNFGWLIILSQLLAVLILERAKLSKMLTMIGVTVLSVLPWAFQIWQAVQLNSNLQQNLGWAEKPNFERIFRFLNDLYEPFYFQVTTADRVQTLIITVPLILISLVSFFFYFNNWKEIQNKKEVILLLILLKVPILLAFVASWLLPVSIWGTRHLIVSFPLLMIFCAISLAEIKFAKLKITLIAIIILLFGFALTIEIFFTKQTPIYCAWGNLAVELPQKNAERMTLYVFEDEVAYHFWSALRVRNDVQIIKIKGIEGLQEDTSFFLPRGFSEVKTMEEIAITGDHFYIAFRDSKFNELHPPLKNLKSKGYQIGEPKVFVTQGVQAFLVEVKREN